MKGRWSFDLLMAQRLSSTGSRSGSVIAIAGVSCAIVVMLLTWGVAQGFNHQIKSKLIGFEAPITISSPYSYVSGTTDQYLVVDSSLQQVFNICINSHTASKIFRQPTILKTDDNFEAVIICGFDRYHNTDFEKSNIIDGIFPDFNKDDKSIVLSKYTSSKLGINVGDLVTTCFFINDAIKSRKFKIAGIYDSGFGDYDNKIAYGSLQMLQRLNKVDSLTVTNIAIYPDAVSIDSIPVIAANLQNTLIQRAQKLERGKVEVVDNITNTGGLYLSWLDLIETNVIVIFAIMCCLAILTIISSLFINILDRVSTIGLLRAFGISRLHLRNIFVLIAIRKVLWGVLIGNFVVIVFWWLQTSFGIISLDPEMYYLDTVPFEYDICATLAINAGIIIMTWLVLILPARVASSISPSQTMRFE